MTNNIDIDTRPLLNELNNIINASIQNKLSDLVKRNNLLEETHEKLVNLPSVQKFFDTKNSCNECKCSNNDNMLVSVIEEKINVHFIETNILLNKLISEVSELKNEINNLKYTEKENIILEIEEVACEQKTQDLEQEKELEQIEEEELEELEEEELEEEDEEEELEEEIEEEVEEALEELENDIKSIETETNEEDEEDEELIEIEIDDITYCTNDEDNGIIYELDKDGNVGEKIGYLKDGEAYFD